MGKVALTAMLLTLAACSHGQGIAQHAAATSAPLACPNLQSSLGYSVSTGNGPDFIECTMSPLHTGVLPAKLYVGNFPLRQHELQFFGFTPSPAGSLAWFSSATSASTHWVTFIPTGHKFPSVVMLSVESRTAPSLLQLQGIAGIVVSHSPNISLQRTR